MISPMRYGILAGVHSNLVAPTWWRPVSRASLPNGSSRNRSAADGTTVNAGLGKETPNTASIFTRALTSDW